MKATIRLAAVAAGLLFTHAALAQAPAGSTGQCKDGTYSTAASKSGACRGHQGVKEWYAATSAAPQTTKSTATSTAAPAPAAAPAAPAPTPMPAPAKAPATATKAATPASTTPAPGGGPGMVWVNTSSKVYHCPGTKYYGTTKEGKYMSEADAKAAGAHADHGTACSK